MGNGEVFKNRFTRIEGLSSIRRLPRLGKIRLGVKKVSKKTGKEYPSETNYFVCPPEVQKVYGEEPKELDIIFPINDPEVIFPQCYKWYGSSKGLKCRGDGISALRLDDDTGNIIERDCPCELLEKGECMKRATLVFNLPSVSMSGVYQIDLSSYHSIVDINSGIDYARALLGNRIAFIPFKLKRIPKETHGEGMKQIHYTLQLELNLTLKEIKEIQAGKLNFGYRPDRKYEIEPPKEDINPAYDSKEDGAVIVEETEEEAKVREAREAEAREKAKKEYEESKKNEAKLEQEKAEGRHRIRPYKEAKVIYQKRQEEKEKIKAELKQEDVDNVLRMFEPSGLTRWNEVAYYACKSRIISPEDPVEKLQKMLVEDNSLVNKIINTIEEKKY